MLSRDASDRHDRQLRSGVIQVLSYGKWGTGAAPYTETAWYKKALRYADDTANVIAPLFAYEGITAFFLESAFLGVLPGSKP